MLGVTAFRGFFKVVFPTPIFSLLLPTGLGYGYTPNTVLLHLSVVLLPALAGAAQTMLTSDGPSTSRRLPANHPAGTVLTPQSGLLRTAPAATLTLPDGATFSGEGPGRYVLGNLREVRAAGSGVLDFGQGLALGRSVLSQVAATRTAGVLTNNLSRAGT